MRLVDLHGAEYRGLQDLGADPFHFLTHLLLVELAHIRDAPDVVGYGLLLRQFRLPLGDSDCSAKPSDVSRNVQVGDLSGHYHLVQLPLELYLLLWRG